MTTIITELAQRLAEEIIENLVDLGSADDEARIQYTDWTVRALTKAFKAKDKQIADAKALAEVESKGADKAAAEGVEWMKRCRAAEKRIAELEARTEQQPVRNPVLAYADSYRDMARQGAEHIQIWSVITDLERNIAPLFTGLQSPAPVTVQLKDAVTVGGHGYREYVVGVLTSAGIKIAEGE